jgi:M17 aminopeptidase N-terminal domain 2/Cytosol aminopeptidase family, catalytic domain
MVHVCLSPVELIDPSTGVIDTLCIVGTAKAYQQDFASWVCDEVLPATLSSGRGYKNESPPTLKKTKLSASAETTVLLQSILARLHPSPDSGVSTEAWLPMTSSISGLLRVVLMVLPDKVSRHNAPGNPYGITTLLKRHVRPDESTAVVALVESPDHVRSTVCAIARVGGGLLYNRKTGGSTDRGSTSGSDATSSHAPLLVGGTSILETSLPSMNHLRVLFAPSIVSSSSTSSALQAELASLALGIQLTRRLVDAPCNELHTTAFKEQALAVVRGMDHVTTRVIEGKELEAQGYGALYGVGKAGKWRSRTDE